MRLNPKKASKAAIKRILKKEGLFARKPHNFHNISTKNI
jgi:hypothetical protein